MTTESTEDKFSKWCFKKGYHRHKLNTNTDSGHKSKMPADFFVANNDGCYYVECKERKSGRLSELSQEKRLKLVLKKSNKITSIILINFEEEKILCRLTLNEFLEVRSNNMFKNGKPIKSLTSKNIPIKYHYNWKTLFL
jgi:hypothetical protein